MLCTFSKLTKSPHICGVPLQHIHEDTITANYYMQTINANLAEIAEQDDTLEDGMYYLKSFPNPKKYKNQTK